MKLDDLVGIPWKLNGKSLEGTDCIGIFKLYFFDFKGFKDNNPLFWQTFRQKKMSSPDPDYLKKILDGYGQHIKKYLIMPDDILVFNINRKIHGGILLRFGKFLHSVSCIGSCIDRLNNDYINYLEYGVRLNA